MRSWISFVVDGPLICCGCMSVKFLGFDLLRAFPKYLRMPMNVSGHMVQSFNFLVDRIFKSVESWNGHHLSGGGKEVVIKSVIGAIPLYTMQCFLLPKKIVDSISRAILKFWWKRSPDCNQPIHWIKKDLLFLSKSDGGLGFKDVVHFNRALLAKLAWKLITQPDALVSKILKSKYFPGNSFLEARIRNRPFKVWRSILSVQDLISVGYVLDTSYNSLKWRGESNTFSVRDAYSLSFQLAYGTSDSTGQQSDNSGVKSFWKRLWRLQFRQRSGYSHGDFITGLFRRVRTLLSSM